jgi:hypothetical protein
MFRFKLDTPAILAEHVSIVNEMHQEKHSNDTGFRQRGGFRN